MNLKIFKFKKEYKGKTEIWDARVDGNYFFSIANGQIYIDSNKQKNSSIWKKRDD